MLLSIYICIYTYIIIPIFDSDDQPNRIRVARLRLQARPR